MKKKKLICLCLSSLFTIGLITGCGSGTSDKSEDANTQTEANGGESGDKITLRMAWWGSQTRHDATNKVIEMYEEANPNVDIEAEFYDFDSYFTKLDTLVAANDTWDIFQMGGNFPKYENSIETLGGYIEDGVIDVSDTTDAFLKTTQNNNGDQMGISVGTNTYGIAYDPAMFE